MSHNTGSDPLESNTFPSSVTLNDPTTPLREVIGSTNTEFELKNRLTRIENPRDTHTELKLIYRILRLISDWALLGFFADVCVIGAENVPSDGALILTPCHHNEIIDIATLSATVPHRRIIAYWAKASLFKNIVTRFILSSAGAIPVARAQRTVDPLVNRKPEALDDNKHNNNTVPSSGVLSSINTNAPSSASLVNQQLFDATYEELSRYGKGGGVLAVFPEGTSYTLPRIVQVKEGAARAALGYIQWNRSRGNHIKNLMASEKKDKMHKTEIDDVCLVPVGIVYTDKSRYRSRLIVRYGNPIKLQPYASQYLHGTQESSIERDSTQALTDTIEQELIKLTVNAPDWDTLYAAVTAHEILFTKPGPNIRVKDLHLDEFVQTSQSLVKIFSPTYPNAIDLKNLKDVLLRYHALLYHTGITHPSLVDIPLISTPSERVTSSSTSPCTEPGTPYQMHLSRTTLLPQILKLLISLLPTLPLHIPHIPAYVFGSLASSVLAGEEEEGRAQFKVIFGGLGRAIGVYLFSSKFVSFVRKQAWKNACVGINRWGERIRIHPVPWIQSLSPGFLGSLKKSCTSFLGKSKGLVAALKNLGLWREFEVPGWITGLAGRTFGTILVAWTICSLHRLIIDKDYARYQRLRALIRVISCLGSSEMRGTNSKRIAKDKERDKEESELMEPFLSTPPPPANPFVRIKERIAEEKETEGEGNAGKLEGSNLESRQQRRKKEENITPKSGGIMKTGNVKKVEKAKLMYYLLRYRAEAVKGIEEVFASSFASEVGIGFE